MPQSVLLRNPSRFRRPITDERNWKSRRILTLSFSGQSEQDDFMSEKGSISRRQFVTAAASVAAASTLRGRALGQIAQAEKGSSQETVKLTESPGWRDQGIENLAKSPHAKLRDIPVRAVTITVGSGGRAATST